MRTYAKEYACSDFLRAFAHAPEVFKLFSAHLRNTQTSGRRRRGRLLRGVCAGEIPTPISPTGLPTLDGHRIAPPVGPFRLVVPGEMRHPRWVREVMVLDVEDAK
jgi:hypothetical protein